MAILIGRIGRDGGVGIIMGGRTLGDGQWMGGEESIMSDEKPWWHGTNYEIMDWIEDAAQEYKLQATFTPNNGIRITIDDPDVNHLVTFDFEPEQAKLIGTKLIEWAERGY